MPHTPNEFAGSDSDRIEQAIAAAVADGSRRLHIPAENAGRNEEVWILDRAIVIPSGFALILDRSRANADCRKDDQNKQRGGDFSE